MDLKQELEEIKIELDALLIEIRRLKDKLDELQYRPPNGSKFIELRDNAIKEYGFKP